MLKKILTITIIICCIFAIIKISNTMASSKEDFLLINKTDEEILYIDKKLEECAYYIKEENWNDINKNINFIYSYWNTVILDLNKLQVKNIYLSEFGKRLDEFTIAANEKNSNITKAKICELYNYIVFFVQSYNTDKTEINKINLKKNLITAYCIADNNDWNLINEYVLKTEESVKNIINLSNTKEHYLDTLYISLKELENSIKIQDLNLFYRKYEIVRKNVSF